MRLIFVHYLKGVVIGIGEHSEFGTVFKMMQNEEVSFFLAHETFLIS